MATLSEEIGAARREYESIRHPGDLSRQLLPSRLRLKSLLIFGSLAASGIAAEAVIGALLFRPLSMPAPSNLRARLPLVQNLPLAHELKLALPPLPGMPADLSLQSVTPSMEPATGWHVPLLDDLHWPTFSQSSEHA
jgi:hypothetical protein